MQNILFFHSSHVLVQVPGGTRCICAFSQDNSVVAVCADGSYHKFTANAKGVFVREKYDLFLELKSSWNCGDLSGMI